MLLKVTIAERRDFVPILKVDGEMYQAPKTLHNGESLEVKDFIGYALLNEYKGCFEVIQEDPIKDAVDNKITLQDVQPEKFQRKRGTKDVKANEMNAGEAALKTAAEHSELAADRIEAAKGGESGDKNALNKQKMDQDAKDAAKKQDAQIKADALAHAAVSNAQNTSLGAIQTGKADTIK